MTKGDITRILSTDISCLFTDQEPHKQVCIQLHLLTSPVLCNIDVEWPFGKVRYRNRLDLQHRLPPSPCSDLSLCYKGRISLRIKWELSTLIWLRRTRFLRGAVVFITSLRFPLRPCWNWVQSDHMTDGFSCPERACMSLMFHSENSIGKYFKSKLPLFSLEQDSGCSPYG